MVMLAPCFVGYSDPFVKEYYDVTLGSFQENGIFATNGPNWEEKDLPRICEVYGEELCETFSLFTGAMGTAIQSDMHFVQNGIVEQMQEFNENWAEGEKKTERVPIENIEETPITFFIANDDAVCPPKQALDHIAMIQSPTKTIRIDDVDHNYFWTSSNDKSFVNKLVIALNSEDDKKRRHDKSKDHHDGPFEMMMKIETLMRWSSISAFMGNLTYLLVATFVTTSSALMAFRYTSKTGYYTTFLSGTGTNWFEIGDYIQNYANFSLFAIAFIT